ncbi:MAG: 30S ribosomal protein S6 [Ignavibacteriae bacterium]|nr:MAG: 30S ribosomal protein S6 [Ignavibacteriota bacterium]
MEKKKNIYETTFIVNAGLDDPQIDAIVDKVQEVITKNSGEIMELAKWGRKRFAYPIKKKNNGFYVVIEFTSSGDLVARLERHFLLEENIIRFLIIGLDKKALQARISGNDLMKLSAPVTPSTSGSPLVGEAPAAEPVVPPAPAAAPTDLSTPSEA